MRSGTYYLNNSGSKWVILDKGKRVKISFLLYGITRIRTPTYFEAFGNYVSARCSVNGKYINVLNYKVLQDGINGN